MKTKQKKIKTAVSVLVLAGLVVFGLTAIGGDLEPSAPPGPTMKTLDEISAEIAQSSPIKNVVRGVIEYTWDQPTSQSQAFSPAVDPNKSVVYLSDAIGWQVGTLAESTIARNGACLMSLTESEITVVVESHGQFNQMVSYQIVEYK